MKITSVRIKRHNDPKNGNLATASVQFENCLVIHDIKLVQLEDKRIISFPNKKMKRYNIGENGKYEESYEYSDIVHPSNKEFREYIETELFRIYDSEERGEKDE